MPFDFAALKAQVRQVVHDTMAGPAEYSHPNYPGVVELRVRWHNKIARGGDLLDSGYSEVIEGIDRVIFNEPELVQKSVTLRRGGLLRLLSPHMRGAVLILDSLEPRVGPIETIWLIAHEK